MTFRLQSKHILLTYPRCDVDKNDLLVDLVALLTTYTPHIRVARELHEDGSPHLHAFIRLDRKPNIRTERFFDLRGHHPNIDGRIRNPQATFDYVSKDGDYCDHGTPGTLTTKWASVISASTAEDFWTSVKEVSPKDFVINHERLEYFASKHYAVASSAYVSPYVPESFDVPQELKDWSAQAFDFEVIIGTLARHTLSVGYSRSKTLTLTRRLRRL